MKALKWITGSLELVLAIPLLGAAIVIGFTYIPLVVMFILHLITAIVTAKQGGKYGASILGIVTSLVAWIPFVGWVMHLITAIILMISAAKTGTEQKSTVDVHIHKHTNQPSQ